MFISSRQNRQLVHSYPEIPYHVSVINSCLSGKLLSVTVNNSLSWNYHIGTVITKCNTLSRIKLYLSTENRKRFYNTYILPYFNCCCIIWGNCTHNLEEKIVKLQKSAARVILDSDFYTHHV